MSSVRNAELCQAQLGNRAGLMGAAYLAGIRLDQEAQV